MMSFLSPLLLWGTALGSIPLIIHLLNRRRFRRVEWAPMKYLKLTIQRNRRRIELEQLLLLLLRISLPILLFILLARPLLNPTGLEKWLGGAGRSSQVVLIDDSLSMGYGAGGPAALQRAKEVAGALAGSIRPQDRCTLITTSAPRSPLLVEVEGARGEDIAAAIGSVAPTGTHAAWPAVLDGVDEVLRACASPSKTLTIITDLRKAGWERGVAAIARKWKEEKVRVRLVDVGADATANVTLQEMRPLDRTVLAGAESRWEAVVRNNTPRALAGTKAILRVDDKPTEIALPDIAARQVLRIPLAVQFPGAGTHDVSLQLADDEMPADNRRWAAVPVKDSLLIRLVDGEPSAEPFGSEIDYLAAPLSIGVGAAEAWRVEVALEDNFLGPRLETPDVLVLANVAAITPEQAREIKRLVREGMGLIVFTGPKLDIGLYNDLLGGDRDPILPAALKGLVDEPIRGVIVEDLRPSPLEALLELKPTALERVAAKQVMAVEEKTEEGKVRVLARWNDPKRSPAILERAVGEGKVLLWATTADRAGNDWPVEPSFVLAVREAVKGTARPTRFDHNVTAGEPVRRRIRTGQQVANVRLTPPAGEPQSLSAVPVEEPPSDLGPAVDVTVADTRRAGLYRLTWEEGPLGTLQDSYAANPDPRESELERLAQPDLKKLLDPLDVDVVVAGGDDAAIFAPTGRELWRELLAGLFGLMVVESAFATWVGRAR